MAFQSSPIFSLPRARLECSELIFRFMRTVGVCVLLIIMDGPGEKRLASVKWYEGDPPEGAPKVRLWQGYRSQKSYQRVAVVQSEQNGCANNSSRFLDSLL